MGVWEYGSMGVGEYGSMGVWEYGSMGVWEYGSMGVWEYGSMGVWEYGSMGVWEDGCEEVPLHPNSHTPTLPYSRRRRPGTSVPPDHPDAIDRPEDQLRAADDAVGL